MSDPALESFDPLRFHYIETLKRRAEAQPAPIRQLLEQRLNVTLEALRDDFARAQAHASPVKEHGAGPGPLADPLADLLRHLAHPTDPSAPQGEAPELKAIAAFRSTWSELSAGRQLTQAIEQAPENAGPLNSHMLVLRSLATMRDASPDYLKRFMSYVDTLLCLEQVQMRSRPAAKPPARPPVKTSVKQSVKRAPASRSARR